MAEALPTHDQESRKAPHAGHAQNVTYHGDSKGWAAFKGFFAWGGIAAIPGRLIALVGRSRNVDLLASLGVTAASVVGAVVEYRRAERVEKQHDALVHDLRDTGKELEFTEKQYKVTQEEYDVLKAKLSDVLDRVKKTDQLAPQHHPHESHEAHHQHREESKPQQHSVG